MLTFVVLLLKMCLCNKSISVFKIYLLRGNILNGVIWRLLPSNVVPPTVLPFTFFMPFWRALPLWHEKTYTNKSFYHGPFLRYFSNKPYIVIATTKLHKRRSNNHKCCLHSLLVNYYSSTLKRRITIQVYSPYKDTEGQSCKLL